MLMHNLPSLVDEPLIRFFDYFLPGHAKAILTLMLYSLPKQVYYQLRATQLGTAGTTITEEELWKHLIDSTFHEIHTNSSYYDLLQEEVSVLRFHMGI